MILFFSIPFTGALLETAYKKSVPYNASLLLHFRPTEPIRSQSGAVDMYLSSQLCKFHSRFFESYRCFLLRLLNEPIFHMFMWMAP